MTVLDVPSLQSTSKRKPGLTNAAAEKTKNKIQLEIYKSFVTNVEWRAFFVICEKVSSRNFSCTLMSDSWILLIQKTHREPIAVNFLTLHLRHLTRRTWIKNLSCFCLFLICLRF